MHLKPPNFEAARITNTLVTILLILLFGIASAHASPGGEQPGFSFTFKDQQKLGRAIRAQEAQFNKLMRKRGVVGSAIGWDEDGEPVIRIFSDGASRTEIPAELDGFKVLIETTGAIYALKYACRKNNPHRARQCPDGQETAPAASPPGGSTVDRFRPVPNGVSIGHPNITAGTMGCVVTQGCHFFALSNNHVFADENNGNVGDPILQPATLDGGVYPTDAVGTLFDWVEIIMTTSAFNRVDGALVMINGWDFTNATLPDGYGMPRSDWMTPQAGLNVRKSGRRTRHTDGVITGINAVVYVNYNSCCARFVGQLVIEPDGGSDFALAGDSGSLVVARDGANDRRPVGLLFALADDGAAFANPIDDVIAELNIDMILGGT